MAQGAYPLRAYLASCPQEAMLGVHFYMISRDSPPLRTPFVGMKEIFKRKLKKIAQYNVGFEPATP